MKTVGSYRLMASSRYLDDLKIRVFINLGKTRCLYIHELRATLVRVRIGKGHSIVSTREGAEFALVDFISASKGDAYLLANNDTIQIIDPTEDPGNYRQTTET